MKIITGILGILGIQIIDHVQDLYTYEKMIIELAIGIVTITVIILTYKNRKK